MNLIRVTSPGGKPFFLNGDAISHIDVVDEGGFVTFGMMCEYLNMGGEP